MVWHYVKLAWYWWFPVRDEICELTPLLEVDPEKNSPLKKEHGEPVSGPIQPTALRDRGNGLLLGDTTETVLPRACRVRGRRKHRERDGVHKQKPHLVARRKAKTRFVYQHPR